MASFNQVILVGNLGRDPEVRSLGNGSKVASFSIATTEHWKDRNSGEKKSRTEWHNVVVWPEFAVNFCEKLAKGDLVQVVGKLQTRKWQKDGVDRYTTEVVIQGIGTTLQGLRVKALTDGSSRSSVSNVDPSSFAVDEEVPF